MSKKRVKQLVGVTILTMSLAVGTACSSKEQKPQTPTVEASVTTKANVPEATTSTTSTAELENLKFDDVVLKVGESKVTYRELLVYLLQLKNKYEPSLGKEVWTVEIADGKVFEDRAKEELLSQITELKIITQQAAKLDIKLELDEQDEIMSNVKAYLQKVTKEDQEKYGITEEVVKQVLSDNYLAQKVFTITTNEVDTDIKDEEAKQIKVQQIFVMTEGEDKNGTEIQMNEEQKKQALDRANSLLIKAKEAEDFKTFATDNTDASYVEFTFGKQDQPELEKAAFALKEGEISPVIETSTGYAILKLVSQFDETATRQKKEEIIEERQNKVFASKYETWSSEYKVIQEAGKWKEISFAR